MNELLKRTIVALIGIPIAIAVIWLGGFVFTTVIAILSSIALWEFYKLSENKGANPFSITGIIINFILVYLIYSVMMGYLDSIRYEIVIIGMILSSILILLMRTLWSAKPNPILNLSVTFTGLIYISFSFISLFLIRNYGLLKLSENGPSEFQNFINGKETYLMMAILFSIWICDTAAYFIGKKWGKNKLFESVSPKKTWEGAIAGFITGTGFFVLAFYVIQLIFNYSGGFSFLHVIAIGIIISSLGQIGDLAESKLKRDAGVKDSSNLLPGHGGIFDRFDSIMFVFPAILLYLIIFM